MQSPRIWKQTHLAFSSTNISDGGGDDDEASTLISLKSIISNLSFITRLSDGVMSSQPNEPRSIETLQLKECDAHEKDLADLTVDIDSQLWLQNDSQIKVWALNNNKPGCYLVIHETYDSTKCLLQVDHSLGYLHVFGGILFVPTQPLEMQSSSPTETLVHSIANNCLWTNGECILYNSHNNPGTTSFHNGLKMDMTTVRLVAVEHKLPPCSHGSSGWRLVVQEALKRALKGVNEDENRLKRQRYIIDKSLKEIQKDLLT